MWDNLGRVAARTAAFADAKRSIAASILQGLQNLPPKDKPAIFFRAFAGNWELTYPMAHQNGIPMTLVYREANNPYVDKMILNRRAARADDMFPKGPRGAIRMGRAIKNGRSLAMLIDQKMNEGIAVPFFGRAAMTAPAIADLALRYDMPLMPTRIVRTKGCHFHGIIYPALAYAKTGDRDADIKTIMVQTVNTLLKAGYAKPRRNGSGCIKDGRMHENGRNPYWQPMCELCLKK